MSKFFSDRDYATLEDVHNACVDDGVDFTEIAPVDNGWMVFQTTTEYETWLNQQ